ncbi:GlxA family transcriptional regulator [Hymenobacter chitinivorans]|uniref:Transcriptional regulator GlxA family with amidase domain n=1 Tax=Hymenobacter chitinivorans DSM 11115 TaxID=1121954 RepID=A0A2M9B918_9BACT|nr:helix-turn-helix domain-containing protein [Hymenobacter chitinivorans]PJJ54446.1 transcriptional regulator GlxA family with amidase domain [Hymenobacter chitinivorans DSM 11115]
MKHIAILVPQGAVLGSIEGPRLVFSEVNALLRRMNKAPLFDIQLVGLQTQTPVCGGLYSVYTPHLTADVPKTDLVIIPAVDGDPAVALANNHAFLPWIIEQYRGGAEVASLCLGAFLLAATGLIDGRQCTTHWAAAHDFRRMFPQVELVEDRVVTDEHGIYSSGGAFSYLNLVLYLVEKYAGREIALICAKVFQIDIERVSQSAFIMFNGQKEHGDEPIKKAQAYIEDNYQDKITVEQLADMLALGRRNLERRFKKATSNSVVEYIQRVKIEAAKNSLESTLENVNEVMYQVGYSDPKAFRSTFKRLTGLSPKQYRNKYNRTLAPAA